MTVLLTGAAGRIGSQLRQLLPEFGWTLRLLDRRPVDGGVVGDITSASDWDSAIGDGVSAIVHLAACPTEAPWPVLRRDNVEGTVQAFEAARRHSVRRFIFASTIHAAGFTRRESSTISADTPVRPDTLYGVTKAFSETLGRYYSDRYGLEVACLRIAAFSESPPVDEYHSCWFSPRDCARLVDACLRHSDLHYAQVWGISRNSTRWLSLDEGHAIGYEPEDDSGPGPYGDHEFLGGGYVGAEYGIDEIAAEWQ